MTSPLWNCVSCGNNNWVTHPRCYWCARGRVVLVDTVPQCADIVHCLLKEAEVAIDLEGVDLCRTGLVCIIQVAVVSGTIYLFDITTLGRDAFQQGRLRELLESESVCKVIFDGRADNDALFHKHGVTMCNAYDLQILHALCCGRSNDRFVKGLQQCLDDSGVVPHVEWEQLHQLKEDGKRLFVPELGGSYLVWSQRPLQPVLLKYAAADVRFLLEIKHTWGSESLNKSVTNLTFARINHAIHDPEPAKGPHMAIRDFTIGSVPAFLGRASVEPQQCYRCGQVGHLAQNCTRSDGPSDNAGSECADDDADHDFTSSDVFPNGDLHEYFWKNALPKASVPFGYPYSFGYPMGYPTGYPYSFGYPMGFPMGYPYSYPAAYPMG